MSLNETEICFMAKVLKLKRFPSLFKEASATRKNAKKWKAERKVLKVSVSWKGRISASSLNKCIYDINLFMFSSLGRSTFAFRSLSPASRVWNIIKNEFILWQLMRHQGDDTLLILQPRKVYHSELPRFRANRRRLQISENSNKSSH